MAPGWDFEVFYDGDCPLCSREIRMLRRLDEGGRIRFTDVAAPGFDPASLGLDGRRLMEEIHGRLPTGEIVAGVEVFRRLYAAVGYVELVRMSRWPVVAPLLDVAYRVFARNRLRLTGRCDDGACEIHARDGKHGRRLARAPAE
jgi:predicted DCC family thiol-disulfide oxidoreductase YuxK